MSKLSTTAAVQGVKNNPGYREFFTLLTSMRDDTRREYESMPANEYIRGRLNGIQAIMILLQGNNDGI